MLNFDQIANLKLRMFLILFCIGAEIQQSTQQQNNVDSHFDVLKTIKTNSIRIKTLYFLSHEFCQKETDKAINFDDEGIHLTQM